MQDGVGELLHLGDLTGTFPAVDTSFEHDCDTDQSILAEKDRILVREIPPAEIQGWCLEEIAKHRDHILRLREVYGSTARDPILKTKAHIRALRSEYTAAAPIHQRLPAEVLIEVFSHVHPAVVCRGCIPVLHVCRYWRMLVFKTPQFWDNLLSSPMQHSTNPRWCIARFTAALSLSTPRSLTLSLPFWSLDVVDVLIPHASRLASLTLRPTFDIGPTQQLLEHYMPRLRDLVVPNCSQYSTNTPLILYFHQYPEIRSLQINVTLFFSPVAPCTSLRHLKLRCCTLRAWPQADHVSSMHSVHYALELFPNLETISLTHTLSDTLFEDPPELSKTVHLPRLRRLEIADVPMYISYFLSHLVFPPTTSLVFKLGYGIFQNPLSAPVFPGINPSPSPDAEISLHINFLHVVDPSLVHPEGLAHWETHGEGARPVRVTLIGVSRILGPIAHFTRELAHALAPPPSRGVTVLKVTGTWTRSSDDRHPQAHHLLLGAWEYWTAFLPDLAGLRRIACTGLGATKDFIAVLGRPLPQSSEFPCPRVAELALVWHLSHAACEYFELEQDGLGPARGDVGSIEPDLGDAPNSSQDVELEDGARARHATASQASLSLAVIASLCELCGTLGACLAARAVGLCEPIGKLSVALRGWSDEDLYMQQWQITLVERQLREGLGHLVGEVAVVDEVD